MKEAAIVKKIRDHLKAQHNTLCFKHHGGPYSEVGVADLICVMPGGHALYLEIKQPGKKPSPAQVEFLKRYKEQGAITGVATSIDDVENILESSGLDKTSV